MLSRQIESAALMETQPQQVLSSSRTLNLFPKHRSNWLLAWLSFLKIPFSTETLQALCECKYRRAKGQMISTDRISKMN